jgi:nucleotide-binding universal stress UspA family protein
LLRAVFPHPQPAEVADRAGIRVADEKGLDVRTAFLRKDDLSLPEKATEEITMRTLMATDGSAEATAALRTAARLLRHDNNEVHLLCVAPDYNFPRGRSGNGKAQTRNREVYRRRISKETDEILKQTQRVLLEDRVQTFPISKIGSPTDEIIRLAAEYDITVIGARSRYNRSELGLGPVASRVVEYAPGIVLVARELAGDPNLRVLVGVDGSVASKQALRSLVACFDVDEAEITLMHVAEMPWIHIGLERDWFDSGRDVSEKPDPETQLENELRREGEEVIDDARTMLEDRSYSIETVIEEGNPATEILGQTEVKEYDLIVLGTSGLTDVKHAMLGSVSAKVAWNARCSVALVK